MWLDPYSVRFTLRSIKFRKTNIAIIKNDPLKCYNFEGHINWKKEAFCKCGLIIIVSKSRLSLKKWKTMPHYLTNISSAKLRGRNSVIFDLSKPKAIIFFRSSSSFKLHLEMIMALLEVFSIIIKIVIIHHSFTYRDGSDLVEFLHQSVIVLSAPCDLQNLINTLAVPNCKLF